jgi:hypothetical protein
MESLSCVTVRRKGKKSVGEQASAKPKRLSNIQARRLVRAISRKYRIQEPKIALGSNRMSVLPETFAKGIPTRISLPRWAKNALVICHEMTHVIAPQVSIDGVSNMVDGHGYKFCTLYLKLVEEFVGSFARQRLYMYMDLCGVDYAKDNIILASKKTPPVWLTNFVRKRV